MFDTMFIRDDVKKFIKQLKTSERYFQKSAGSFNNHFIHVSNEMALYIFYEALIKYKIILDDEFLLDEYLEQLDKLYRKLSDFDNIRLGINKLICKMLLVKLSINDVNDKDSRDKVITYIYDKYIKNGYYVHGFNFVYKDKIEKEGLIPEQYENYYDRFREVNKMLEKYNLPSIISKNFDEKQIYFTDDIVMGCYYSLYAPMFYYQFLMNEASFGRIRKDNCLIEDYDSLIRHLKRFINNNGFNEKDKKFILDLVHDEWNLIHRDDKKISLLFIKRNMINIKEAKLDDYLKDNSSLYEVVDRLLSPKYSHLDYGEVLFNDDFSLLLLDDYYEKKEEVKKSKDDKKLEVNNDFSNKYGSVSIFILLGAIFISLGVIISIITMFGG